MKLAIASCLLLFSALPSAGVVFRAAVSHPARAIDHSVRAGGGTDIVARVMAQQMSQSFDQSVVVDNRPGAGGNIGEEMIVRATPDGYTLGLVSGYGTNAAIYKLSFDPVNDVQAVIAIGGAGFVVAVHPAVQIKTTSELIVFAKANPGKLNYGSSGTGAITHLATELFGLMAGIRMMHIPFKGTGPALTALLGNQVEMMFGSMPSTVPHVKAGRLRGIAVTTAQRVSALPEMPIIADTVPGYEAVIVYGVMGPKGLPAEVVRRWNSAVNKSLETPQMKERLANDGMEPIGGASHVFHGMIKRDVEKWRRVVKEAKLSFTS
ncbi:MAG: tripartite tricarboxylate transporter substrate binding protein [Betaproteobacteria bacterium]|nr:tripartite tricarboxylate transporter substrate binding protein [Betaproteobacteria bacterium]